MQKILTQYSIPPTAMDLINKYDLSVSNTSINWEKAGKYPCTHKIMFECRLHIKEEKICTFHIKWEQGSILVFTKHLNKQHEVLLLQIQDECEAYEGIWPLSDVGYNNLGCLITLMIKKLYFDNVYKQLKSNHILRQYSNDHFSNRPWYPLSFIPRRYNSKPFSNMSPAERRKWHIKTVFDEVPIYNPEIFTLYKMHDAK